LTSTLKVSNKQLIPAGVQIATGSLDVKEVLKIKGLRDAQKYLVKELPVLNIIPIPGPSALISALSVSGFSADKFIFLGFPPVKNKRKKFFKKLQI